jgi:predicted amidohydrolase YtcJ
LTQSSIALLGGRIAPQSSGEADSLLVIGDRIAAAGTEREIAAQAPPGTSVIALRGRLVVPGFHDSHYHFLQSGVLGTRPSASGCTSLDETGELVRAVAKDAAADEILRIEGWDESRWRSPVWPDRSFLDRVAPSHAVFLRRTCGHVAVTNTLGLERLARVWSGAGVNPATGVCREAPVLALDDLFPVSAREAREALWSAARLCLSRGITTTTDFLNQQACRTYARFLQESEPPVRLDAYLLEPRLDEEEDESPPVPGPSERFRIRGRKTFADGSIGGRTAAVSEDYVGFPGERGQLLLTEDRLLASVRRAHEEGYALLVHAIGDRAIAQVLDAFSTFPAEANRERHHRIEHFELPAPGDVERAAGIGVRICMQPNFVGRWAGPDGLYERLLGPQRLRRMNPLRSVIESGASLCFGSDGMPTSPLFGIRSALEHPVEAQRLTFAEGLHLYTAAGADAVREDQLSGRIAPGCEADLTVLPAEPLSGVSTERKAEVDLTILAGEVRFSREAAVPAQTVGDEG